MIHFFIYFLYFYNSKRLTEWFEKNKHFTPIQCGFWKYHSTLDHLVRFDTYIRQGFADNKHVTATFFDLEKAYDLTWRRGILPDLHDAGIRGRLASYIERFLENKQFKVRVGTSLSYTRLQATGVPQ